jgi:predicted nucleotidyltransferase
MDTRNDVKAKREQESKRALSRLKEIVPAILAQYPVEAAYAYGSVARGIMTPLSDVDIALLLADSLSPSEQLDLELTIQGKLESASGYSPVDVRAVNQAPLLVQARIVQQGILIYERDRSRRVTFEVMTRKRYFDFAPVARRLRDAFLERAHKEGLIRG